MSVIKTSWLKGFIKFGQACLLATVFTGCSDNVAVSGAGVAPQPANTEISYQSFVPIPLKPFQLDQAVVALGDQLFHDVRLSGDNTIACASCHIIAQGGVDQQQHSTGVSGRKGDINSPTVFNAAFNFKQFWDGRVNTLEEQVNGPINNAKEMDSNWPQVIGKLSQDKALKSTFKKLFKGGITADNIRHAIATYERSLTTPNARFDQYLRGDSAALSKDEIKGFERFKKLGCNSCHQGVNLGGNMFQTFGVMRDYFANRETLRQSDLGRYNVTKNPQDKHKFKVPSLRNIALTAPYFHDGSAPTLEQAVTTMAYYQLGLRLTQPEVEELVKFLNTLTGSPFNSAGARK
ncbi:MAG: cytochrome c peroxidase [Phenylobacterium sp.]|jgi:cytochrome c peroxidase